MGIAFATLVRVAVVGAWFFLWPGIAVALDVVPLPEAAREDWVEISATVTAYTSSVDETDDTPNITASGKWAGEGMIACPAKYAFGQKVRVNGKVFSCEDRMAKRFREIPRFDMWMASKAEAYQWGVRTVIIEIQNG